jgi:hypothetical protein
VLNLVLEIRKRLLTFSTFFERILGLSSSALLKILLN